MRIYLILFSFVFIYPIMAQQTCELCDALTDNDFKKVEKLIVTEIEKRENGTLIDNGSTTYTTYNKELDEIVDWLSNKTCVKDVQRDKWGAKILLYPGRSTIGVQFKRGNEIIEKCYNVTEGRIKGKRSVDKLTYVGSSVCTGFIADQYKLRRLSVDLIPHKGQALIGYWMDSTGTVGIHIGPATEFDKEQLILQSISNSGIDKTHWFKDSTEIIMSTYPSMQDTLGQFKFSFCSSNDDWCYQFKITDLHGDELILRTKSAAGIANSNLNPKPRITTIWLKRNDDFE